VPRVDAYLVKRAMLGDPGECGDTGVLRVGDSLCLAALVDVLGHGRGAHDVAIMAEEHLLGISPDTGLTEVMNGLHDRLKGTRGAVASLCRIDMGTGLFRFVGVGNITTRIMGRAPQRLVSRDGVIGYKMTAPREESAVLSLGDIVIMHSDGVSENGDWLEHPELLTGRAREIAEGVLEYFGKQNDDASCLVIRYLK
jgi:phosphoserine phosphatase RsbX